MVHTYSVETRVRGAVVDVYLTVMPLVSGRACAVPVCGVAHTGGVVVARVDVTQALHMVLTHLANVT